MFQLTIITISESICKFFFHKAVRTCFYYNTDNTFVNSKVSVAHCVFFLYLKYNKSQIKKKQEIYSTLTNQWFES